MEAKECIFCKIASKAIPSNIVYEDKNIIAFLDINPRSTGMTIVAPKLHYSEFDENFEFSKEVFESAEIVAEMIKQSLRPKFIDFSIIPSQEVPHFHIRVYPVFENETPLIENQPNKMGEEDLKEIAAKIKSVVVKKKEKETEEVPVEKAREETERSKEEIDYIKKQLEKA